MRDELTQREEELRATSKKLQAAEKDFNKYRAQIKSDGDRRQQDVDALENRLAEARRGADAAKKRYKN